MRFRSPAALLVVIAFTLTACDDSTGPEDGEFLGCGVTAVSVGETLSESLSSSDCRLEGAGEFVDYYGFSVGSDRSITIDMVSNQVDTYVILFDRESGDVVAQDDDGGAGFNARLRTTVAEGSYVVGATSFAAGDTGPYELSIQ